MGKKYSPLVETLHLTLFSRRLPPAFDKDAESKSTGKNFG